LHIAEGATDPEHPLSRLQYLQDLVATLIGLEHDGAEEDGVLVEQLASPVDVALLDSGTEAVREHRCWQPSAAVQLRGRLTREQRAKLASSPVQ
jgi:hypothetical protein